MTLSEWALYYISKGWFILPLHYPHNNQCSCGNPTCRSPGKHPIIKGGIHNASLDSQQVKKWWAKWPQANIGIATGIKSQIIVIDVDKRDNGLENWDQWSKAMNVYTQLIAQSGQGWHFYFNPEENSFKSRTNIIPGVDVRAEGGMIVAPGSLHVSGKKYTWFSEDNPNSVESQLKKLLTEKQHSHTRLHHTIPEGSRNTFLFSLGGFLLHHKCSQGGIKNALNFANANLIARPLESDEVTKIAHNLEKYSIYWEKPEPLKKNNFELDELNLQHLPQTIKPWIQETSELFQSPPECLLVPLLTGLSSLIGNKININPKQHNASWSESCNLWGLMVGRPGALKSPLMREGIKFLEQLSRKSLEDYDKQKTHLESRTEAINARIEGTKEAIKKAVSKGLSNEEILKLETQLKTYKTQSKNNVFKIKKYMINDTTIEKLAIILKDNQHGVLIFRDELAGWAARLNQNPGDREFFLEGWNGKGQYVVERIQRGSLFVPNLCISVLGSIQPAKLTLLGGDDGLLQRFQLATYPNLSKQWNNIDKTIKPVYEQQLETLYQQAASFNPSKPVNIKFAPEAQILFDEWHTHLEKTLRSNELSCLAFEAHLAKYRSFIPKLALLFSFISQTEKNQALEQIDLKSLESAIAVSELFKQHAQKIYSEESTKNLKASMLLARKIKTGEIKDGDTLRSLYRHRWPELETLAKVQEAIDYLEEKKWVFADAISSKRRQIKILRINPQLNKTPGVFS